MYSYIFLYIRDVPTLPGMSWDVPRLSRMSPQGSLMCPTCPRKTMDIPGCPWHGVQHHQVPDPSCPICPRTTLDIPGCPWHGVCTLQKMTCYFDNCICYQNCNCDMLLRDDAMLVPCKTSTGNVGICSPCGIQQQLKFALSTKILANVKSDWPL